MKILFDNNIPRRLRRSLKGHEVHTARESCWATLRNGDLLRAAEDAGYEVMVTADQDLSYQQNLSGRRLALVVLDTNNWSVIQQNAAPIVNAIEAAIGQKLHPPAVHTSHNGTHLSVPRGNTWRKQP